MGRLADANLTDEEFEAVCDGCGKCCELKGLDGLACPSLDTTTNRCMNYDTRLDHHYAMCSNLTVHNIEYMHRVNILPASCAYVRYERGLPALPRPVQAAKLIPFILAGPDQLKKYAKARAKWDKLRERR